MKELKDQMEEFRKEVALLRKAGYDPGKILKEYRLEHNITAEDDTERR